MTIDRSNFTSDVAFEVAWISEYVRERHAWLSSVPRLVKTNYRTKFFQTQIANKNWSLDLPINVHGVKLTRAMFADPATAAPEPEISETPVETSHDTSVTSPTVVDQAPPPAADTTPSPEPTVMTLPTLKRAWHWLGSLSFAGIGTTTWAAFNGLPPWAVFMLGVLTASAIIGLSVFVYTHRKRLFALLNKIADTNADPEKPNIEVK